MSAKLKVVICDFEYPHVEEERAVLAALGDIDFIPAHCETEEELIELTHDADGVINQFAHLTANVIGQMEKCKVIASYGIGVDKIDIEAAGKKGIVVCNVPDYCIDEVADHSMALILACARQLLPLDHAMKAGVWGYRQLTHATHRLRGETIGLLGFGKIPRNLAEKCKAFGLKVVIYDPFVTAEQAEAAGVTKLELDALLQTADLISAHVPLTKQTHHMIGRAQFQLMKPSAYLINAGRGGLVDDAALVDALRQGHIAGAALDTFEVEPLAEGSPLRELPNVILTPHAAWYSEEAVTQLQRSTAMEIVRVLSGEQPKSPVNRRFMPDAQA